MKIDVTKSFRHSDNGAVVNDYAAGMAHDVTTDCARFALTQGHAEPADDEAKALLVPVAPVVQAPRNRSRGNAPENK